MGLKHEAKDLPTAADETFFYATLQACGISVSDPEKPKALAVDVFASMGRAPVLPEPSFVARVEHSLAMHPPLAVNSIAQNKLAKPKSKAKAKAASGAKAKAKAAPTAKASFRRVKKLRLKVKTPPKSSPAGTGHAAGIQRTTHTV